MALGLANGRAPPPLWHSLTIAAMFPLSVAALSLWLLAQFDDLLGRQEEVEESYRQQALVAALISDMKDAETGQRGFILTGDPAFLTPYSDARGQIGTKLKSLQAVFANESPEIRRRVGRIAALVPSKFAEMQRVLDVRDRQGRDPAAAIVSGGLGKRMMDEIRTEAGAIEIHQRHTLETQLSAATENVARSRQIYFVAVSLITALSLFAAFMLWNNRRARQKATLDAINAGQRQAAIFESALNAIILINPSGSIEVLNPAAERLFGYPARNLVRRDMSIIADLAPGEGPFLARLGLGAHGLAEPFRPLVRARRADGETVPVEVALGLMPLEDGMHIVAVFSDVTEREKVEQIKDQFLSTVSHELRTPLTSIVGSLGLLKAGVADAISPQAHRLVDIAENNAHRLIRIVNDILDAEKLQSGQMSFAMQPLDLCDVVKSAANGMEGFATTKAIRIVVTCLAEPVVVRGDSERLMQVVNNLVSNAIKFSPNESSIAIDVRRAGQKAVVSIADQGPGIPEALRARLFTRFAQAPGAAMKGVPGTGLGLSIARDIVRSHDGMIAFADGASGGTVFSFDLPLWDSVTAQEELNGSPRLLLFTDAGEAEALSAGFATRAIRVDMVKDVAAAIDAVKARRYLAMVVDFQFAGVDAPAVIQAVRAEPLGSKLPIIGIASETAPVGPADTAAIDIIDWLPKPFSAAMLDDAMAAAIARATVAMPLVLHIDDDLDTLHITATALAGVARVAQASDLKSARAFLAENDADILIIDIGLPDGSGLDLVSEMTGTDRAATPVIIYSAQDGGGYQREVEAVLTKSKKSLPNLVETVLAIRARQEEGQYP